MAVVYPFSQRTAARLAEPPSAGSTHRWLAQVASGVSQVLTPQKCFEFLRRCCDVHVAHRRVPDREIEGAVEFAYSGQSREVQSTGLTSKPRHSVHMQAIASFRVKRSSNKPPSEVLTVCRQFPRRDIPTVRSFIRNPLFAIDRAELPVRPQRQPRRPGHRLFQNPDNPPQMIFGGCLRHFKDQLIMHAQHWPETGLP